MIGEGFIAKADLRAKDSLTVNDGFTEKDSIMVKGASDPRKPQKQGRPHVQG